MANQTAKEAATIKGTNPQYLIEKIIRSRIYECQFWKEECFALTAELLVDKAMQLKYLGGVYSGVVKPTPFICLLLKMLQIQPEKDIILEFIRQQEFKYVRALGAMYMRLTASSLDCFKFLEPLLLDYRKLRQQNRDGKYELLHFDEFVDGLLTQERMCDCILPRIQKRHVLEETNQLEPRTSGLDDDLDDGEEEEEEHETPHKGAREHERRSSGHRDWDRDQRSPSPKFRRSRSPPRRRSVERDRDHHREHRDHDAKDRHKERDTDRHRRERSREKDRHRRRSRSKERKHRHDDDRHHKHKSSSSSKSKSSRQQEGGHSSSSTKDKKGGMSVEETNKMRASLGMKPLRP